MKSYSPFESKFCFWGNRNYVQSSNIIYGLFKAAKYWNLGNIRFYSALFHRFIKTQGSYHLYDNQGSLAIEKSRFCTIFDFKTDCGSFTAGLEEGSGLISERTADDEAKLISECIIDPSEMTAILKSFPPDRLFTVIIAMNKGIHQQVFPNSGFGNWLVGRFDFHLIDDNNQPAEILVKISRHIAKRMTKSIIMINGTPTGEIFFNRQEL